MTTEDDVALLRYLVLDDEHIPHVFAAMGFGRRIAVFQRGALRWWAATDGPVWLMWRQQPEFCAYVDRYTGRWTTLQHAPRGRDLIALAALAWRCSYAQAARHLAAICDVS
jgi:hypothetical protein